MPSHLAAYEPDTDDPAEEWVVSISGGEESAIKTVEIWNDKLAEFGDTTTATDIRAKLLASSSGGPYLSTGVPLLDERWTTFRVTAFLTLDVETTDGVTGTLRIGTNSEQPLPDLAPQTGVRIDMQVIAPGGRTADAMLLKLRAVGNEGSAPLAQFVSLATGSAIVPADRIASFRGLLRGSEVVADDTDTVTINGGLLAYEGTETAFPAEDVTFTLADGDAVDIGADEAYLVQLSRAADGTITATRGPKAEAVTYPAKPADDIFVANLRVYSADGVAVTVAQSDVDQSATRYGEFMVRDGGGQTITIDPGDGLSDTDHRLYLSHRVPVALSASSVNRIWMLPDRSFLKTLTDVLPMIGAQLLALVTTDGSGVTAIADARTFAHRALTMDRIDLVYRGVLTDLAEPSYGLALAYAHGDFEIESLELNLSDLDGGWTSGALQADVLVFAPGAPVPFPAGGLGTGGVSLFTSSGIDDQRPGIAYDAADLRAVTMGHEVRRIIAGSRLMLAAITTMTGPGSEPEQEVRVTLHVRRYR